MGGLLAGMDVGATALDVVVARIRDTLDDLGANERLVLRLAAVCARVAPLFDPASVVEAFPAGLSPADIHLDDEDIDARVALFELACQVYDLDMAAHGHDDVGTMLAVCWLAHAHALLGQMYRQVDEAWALIDPRRSCGSACGQPESPVRDSGGREGSQPGCAAEAPEATIQMIFR